MKYYGIFIDGKLELRDGYPEVWVTNARARHEVKGSYIGVENVEIGEVLITRVPRARRSKASKK